MRLIRWFIGRIILFGNWVTLPKPIIRKKIDQDRVDKKTEKLTIYQFEACPFCVKVRRFIRKNNLKINLKDAKNNHIFKAELMDGGGKHKVPCLRIEKINSKTEWLYESTEIINFLKNNIAR
jgi:glutaredoxin|tara:strand:- start:3699 stop:4064 length:366 start_codon:yes stop_codon:yes gene_type:complete